MSLGVEPGARREWKPPPARSRRLLPRQMTIRRNGSRKGIKAGESEHQTKDWEAKKPLARAREATATLRFPTDMPISKQQGKRKG
eukprot:16441291-Heterocapsa_arctica.AAC.1